MKFKMPRAQKKQQMNFLIYIFVMCIGCLQQTSQFTKEQWSITNTLHHSFHHRNGICEHITNNTAYHDPICLIQGILKSNRGVFLVSCRDIPVEGISSSNSPSSLHFTVPGISIGDGDTDKSDIITLLFLSIIQS